MNSHDIAQATDVEVSVQRLGTPGDPIHGVVMRLTLLHHQRRVQTEAISFSIVGARALAKALLSRADEAERMASARPAH
jgi:hypothetical protein